MGFVVGIVLAIFLGEYLEDQDVKDLFNDIIYWIKNKLDPERYSHWWES